MISKRILKHIEKGCASYDELNERKHYLDDDIPESINPEELKRSIILFKKVIKAMEEALQRTKERLGEETD